MSQGKDSRLEKATRLGKELGGGLLVLPKGTRHFMGSLCCCGRGETRGLPRSWREAACCRPRKLKEMDGDRKWSQACHSAAGNTVRESSLRCQARQARWLAGNTLGCGRQDVRERGEVLLATRRLLMASEGGLGGYWWGAEWAILAKEGEQPPMGSTQQDEAPGKVGQRRNQSFFV